MILAFLVVHNIEWYASCSEWIPISILFTEGDNKIPFDVDVSPLIPGKYYVTIALVIKNSWENSGVA